MNRSAELYSTGKMKRKAFGKIVEWIFFDNCHAGKVRKTTMGITNLRKALVNYFFSERRGRMIELSVSSFSQLYHLVAFELKKPKLPLKKAMMIISIDVDVGNRKLGQINKGKNDANVHRWYSEYFIGEVEERAIKLFVEMFNILEIPATFAIRGQLTEIDASILELLLKSPIDHDIGAHGYSHKSFRNLSQKEAESELNMISVGMEKFGVVPRSFIFPGNSVAHLRLLEKFGYECFRDNGGFYRDAMCIEKKGLLYNIRPSLYLNQSLSPVMLEKILNVAIAKRAPLHLWFHPWNFGNTNELIKKSIDDVLLPFLTYAKNKEKCGMLTFETMLSAARKADKILGTIV